MLIRRIKKVAEASNDVSDTPVPAARPIRRIKKAVPTTENSILESSSMEGFLHVEVGKKNLLNALKCITKIIDKKTYNSIMQCCSMIVNAEGMFLTATDFESFLKIKVPAIIKGHGRVVVNLKMVKKCLGASKADDFEFTQEGMNLKITSGGVNFMVIGEDPNDFPEEYADRKCDKAFTISSENIQKFLGKVAVAADKSSNRWTLDSVRMKLEDKKKNGKLVFASADGRRCALIKTSDFSDDGKFSDVSMSTLSVAKLKFCLSNIADKEIEVSQLKENLTLKFKSESMEFHAKVLEGDYPDVEDAISKFDDGFMKTKVHRKEAIDALNGLLPFTGSGKKNYEDDSRGIVIEFLDGEIAMSPLEPNAETGLAKLNVKAETEKSHFKLVFNVDFLLAALKTFDSEMVNFEFTSDDYSEHSDAARKGFLASVYAVNLTEDSCPGHRHLIMAIAPADKMIEDFNARK